MNKIKSTTKNQIRNPQYAPCVVSKSKLALGLPNTYRCNSKVFTKDYWETVLNYLAEMHDVKPNILSEAISKYEYYLQLRKSK